MPTSIGYESQKLIDFRPHGRDLLREVHQGLFNGLHLLEATNHTELSELKVCIDTLHQSFGTAWERINELQAKPSTIQSATQAASDHRFSSALQIAHGQNLAHGRKSAYGQNLAHGHKFAQGHNLAHGQQPTQQEPFQSDSHGMPSPCII